MPTKLKTNKDFTDGYEQGKTDAVKDFANYLIETTKFLPKEPNGHSKVYDEAGIIHFIEVGLEHYFGKIE